jgi:hypothetical protein
MKCRGYHAAHHSLARRTVRLSSVVIVLLCRVGRGIIVRKLHSNDWLVGCFFAVSRYLERRPTVLCVRLPTSAFAVVLFFAEVATEKEHSLAKCRRWRWDGTAYRLLSISILRIETYSLRRRLRRHVDYPPLIGWKEGKRSSLGVLSETQGHSGGASRRQQLPPWGCTKK